MARKAVAVGIAALGGAVGVFSLDVARDDPSYWFAGSSPVAGAVFLAAGWSLLSCGLVFWLRRPGNGFGPLLAIAGLAWFLPEWNNPGIGSSLAFTVGLCLYSACPPLIGHATLAYPRGALVSVANRTAVLVAYVGAVLVLGVLPALFFDPAAQGCADCPSNLVLLSDRSSLASSLTRFGLNLGLAWALALVVLAAAKVVGAPNATRPVFAAGAVYFALVGALFAVSLEHGFVSNGTLERRLWLGQGAALGALALAVAWRWVRNRRARSEVARLVVDLAQSPPPGGLRDALAELVDDPGLLLAYPLGDSGRLVDASGRPVQASAGQVLTRLVREGSEVAVIAHAPRLLDDEQLVEELTAAAGLALGNERLRAEVQARLHDLRDSRARFVETGDAERKRLERDLHDGAQQRLVGLTLSLRLARSQLPRQTNPEAVARLDEAEAELRGAIAELRELAHGIFPAVLADEGFAAAIEALAEDGRVPVMIRSLPDERFAPPVESAAYTVVAETAGGTTSPVVVDVQRVGEVLRVDVASQDLSAVDVVALEDRVGALDGRLEVLRREDGWVTIRAELPCGS
jgi:signal transduction histidine kinase